MQPLLEYFKAMLNPGQGVLLFALRTIVAGLLTLYLAFLFDLDQPKWSIMAVVIVSQPLGAMPGESHADQTSFIGAKPAPMSFR